MLKVWKEERNYVSIGQCSPLIHKLSSTRESIHYSKYKCFNLLLSLKTCFRDIDKEVSSKQEVS